MLKEGVEVQEKAITDCLKHLVKTKIASFAVPSAFLVSLYCRECPFFHVVLFPPVDCSWPS